MIFLCCDLKLKFLADLNTMNSEQPRNKLSMPLPSTLLAYIRHEYPDLGPIIVSTVEYTVKESRNHYADVMRALEPLLREGTKNFVDKLFMFRKKMCRDGTNCVKPFCLFAHDEDELTNPRRPGMETNKRPRVENREVIFNRVDESKFSADDIKEYALKYGPVASVKRLNKGKYLVGFETAEGARKLVECTGFVLNDLDITKFYNINIPVEPMRRGDLGQLFQEQKELLDRLTISFDLDVLSDLRAITFKIRSNVLMTEQKSEMTPPPAQNDEECSTFDVESSMYYNMFAE